MPVTTASLRANFDRAHAVIQRGLVPHHYQEPRLSDREYEVLIALGHGDQVKDIAKRLNVSPSTVSTYRLRILTKLGLERDAQLVLLVAELETQGMALAK